MYILNIGSATKKISVNEIRDFIFENYYLDICILRTMIWIFLGKQLFLRKADLLLLVNKLIEKIPDPCNAKEHYQS